VQWTPTPLETCSKSLARQGLYAAIHSRSLESINHLRRNHGVLVLASHIKPPRIQINSSLCSGFPSSNHPYLIIYNRALRGLYPFAQTYIRSHQFQDHRSRFRSPSQTSYPFFFSSKRLFECAILVVDNESRKETKVAWKTYIVGISLYPLGLVS
jgi:hypothetical protein